MWIKRQKGWEIPDRLVTPETVFLNRRALLQQAGLGAGLMAAGAWAEQAAAQARDPSARLYPASRNDKYQGGRPLTKEDLATTYNNFYEFGSHKNIWRDAQKLKTRPWTVTIDGLVEKPQRLAIDDLLARVKLEERVYRLRCVEAWAMTVPWTGFALADLVKLAAPLSGAKFVRFETFLDSKTASGQLQSWYPWPYIEGVTMAEAMNELAFLVTGAYGKPLPPQMGAPLRLALPWKYGFKSIKSITRISFVAERPVSFWEKVAGNEYGFWANVNPDVPHRRWSQATEELLGEDRRVPTQIFNGYGEFVAALYADKTNEPLFK